MRCYVRSSATMVSRSIVRAARYAFVFENADGALGGFCTLSKMARTGCGGREQRPKPMMRRRTVDTEGGNSRFDRIDHRIDHARSMDRSSYPLCLSLYIIMSTPVVTDKWAGQFDCTVCRRKRLMAAEFSKKALEKHRQQGTPLKCKACVEASQKEEQAAAASKRQSDANDKEERACATCKKELPASEYNRNQWSKGEGKARCRSCVEQAVAAEAASSQQSKQAAITKAREDVARAKATGKSSEILRAESVLSALEAEQVTGLKPVRMSGRGGGGRGRGRFSGRGGRGGRGRR